MDVFWNFLPIGYGDEPEQYPPPQPIHRTPIIPSTSEPKIGWLGYKPDNYEGYKDVKRCEYNDNEMILNTNHHQEYLKYEDTRNCFLDGRYFNAVFNGYEGHCSEPLYIKIYNNEDRNVADVILPETKVNFNHKVIIRVVVDIKGIIRHSCLLMIDPMKENDNSRMVTLFDPVELSRSGVSEIEIEITQMVEMIAGLIYRYLKVSIPNLRLFIESPIMEKPYSPCEISGFCNAHVIKRAVDYLLNQEYDPVFIKRYANMIETNYYVCPHGEVEEEYGSLDRPLTGALVGGAIGAGLGGIAGGPVGAVAGLGVGVLGGYALGSI